MLDNDPSNGKGYESAVAYAVADQLGFSKKEVAWVRGRSTKPCTGGEGLRLRHQPDLDHAPSGPRPSTSPRVTLSAAQAIVDPEGLALRRREVAGGPRRRAARRPGRDDVAATRSPTRSSRRRTPQVYDDTNDAKSALQNGQIDGDSRRPADRVLHHRDVQIPGSTIVGQFEPTREQEQFGLLFEKGNPLVACVNQALDALRSTGTLDQIEQRWLSQVASVPTLS